MKNIKQRDKLDQQTVDFIVLVDNTIKEVNSEIILTDINQIKKRVRLILSLQEWDTMMSLQGVNREDYLKTLI